MQVQVQVDPSKQLEIFTKVFENFLANIMLMSIISFRNLDLIGLLALELPNRMKFFQGVNSKK